jgi:predicted DNA-binding protein (MmcQ/YjbR family)
MTLNEFKTYCLSKSGVTENYPMKGEAVWMKVGGKMFAMTNVRALKMDGETVAPFHFVNLKCDPARALMLREKYSSITPGWHQNKTHWNSILMAKPPPDDLIKDLIDHSYALVARSLPKAEKEGLGI